MIDSAGLDSGAFGASGDVNLGADFGIEVEDTEESDLDDDSASE